MAAKMTCKNSPKMTYTGKEMSPLGLGFCADVENVGVKMMGRDEKEWVVGLKKGSKLWIRTKDEPKETEPVKTKEEEASAAEDSDSEPEEEEEKPPPAKKAPVKKTKAKKEDGDDEEEEKEKPTKKAPPKKTKAETEESEESETEKPTKKTKAKSALDKVLETHQIVGKAADDIKKLFDKKAKKATDEDKPKRAPSTYNKFVKIKLTELRKEQPNLEAKEYMRLAGAEWKLLSDEEKAAFA